MGEEAVFRARAGVLAEEDGGGEGVGPGEVGGAGHGLGLRGRYGLPDRSGDSGFGANGLGGGGDACA